MSQKKHIITIAGRPGSGKSATAKALAKELGYRQFSSGDLFRQLALEKGVSVHEAIVTAGVNDELDGQVDGRLRQIGQRDEKLIIDSRTAWHWIPASFKVFLDLDILIAAKRILDNFDELRRPGEEVVNDPEIYARMLSARLESEMQHYKDVYGIEPYDKTNYDLVVDTQKNSLDQTVNLIAQKYKIWLKK